MAVPRPRGCRGPRSARSTCGAKRHRTLAEEGKLAEGRRLQRRAQGTLKGRRRGRNRRRLIVAAAAVAVVGLLGDVGFPTGAMAMTAGGSHSCAVTNDREVKCWGSNSFGQLGQDDEVDIIGSALGEMGDNISSVPLGDFEANAVEAGDYFSCTLSVQNKVKCWGDNRNGELGLGDVSQRGGGNETENENEMGNNLPTVDVGYNLTVESLAVGSSHVCVVITGGKVKCWGWNNSGQLGVGDKENRGDNQFEMGDNLPYVELGTGVAVSTVALGRQHSCALVDDGGVKCWGSNTGGQLGYEDKVVRGSNASEMGDNLEFVDLGREQKALAISAGAFYTCALLYTGGVKCWGYGSDGQLGQGSNDSIGTTTDSMGDFLTTIDLGTDRKAVALATGAVHACAVLDDDTMKCWGGNPEGNLGLGDTEARGIVPGQMGDNLPAVNLTFGDAGGLVSNVASGRLSYHSCVSGKLGGITCFGLNSFGQLGVGIDSDFSVGDDPGETETLTEIDLGTQVTAIVPDAPGAGFEFVTISPTSAPTPAPTPRPSPAPTSFPTLAPSTYPETRAPVAAPTFMPASEEPAQDPTATDPASEDAGDDGDDGSAMIGIVSAGILIPIVALVALYCCWRRRNQKQRVGKTPVSIASCGFHDADERMRQQFTMEDGTPTDENGDLEDGGVGCESGVAGPQDSAVAAKAATPEAQATGDVLLASAPKDGVGFPIAARLRSESSSAPTVEISTEDLQVHPATTIPTASATPTATNAVGAAPPASAGTTSDDDDSSWGGRSEAENPRALRRSGSNSSISTLDSTSTASSNWPGSVGFVTPARTEIPRGSGSGRPPGRGRGHASSASGSTDSFSAGLRTPASHAAATPGRAEPDTPSPRSGSGSVHGTPHPPEMRLAQFVRAPAGGNALHGLPEMEVGRSPSAAGLENSSGGDPSMPLLGSESGGRTPLTASTIAAAAAAAAAGGGGFGSSGRGGAISPEDAASPTLLPSLTPARVRHGGEDDYNNPGRRVSGRQSNRSSGTSASPAAAGGGVGGWAEPETGGGVIGVVGGGGFEMGPEAAAQAFTEEAELEALQIDKNDLKLVFGRPFARRKSSEVYQVTHEGRNRAAKIIDLFSLGVVGEEVTRMYACFAKELRAMKGIRHECVAVVYGAVATPSELTIVTDLVKRGSLRGLLDDKFKRESIKAPARHRIIKDVAAGMAYLSEQGIEHRNLHSHNVLITKDWGAKVTDYGLSRTTGVMLGAHDRSHSSRANKKRGRAPHHRSGTLRWTAPELLKPSPDGSDPFTEASDVYSLGVIVWEMLCGGSKVPYDGVADDKVKSMILEGSTPPVSMETPLIYSKLMLLCWRKNPSSRPSFSHIDTVLLKDPPLGALS